MNLGLFSHLIDLSICVYFSLPYLDPTDPFFQTVGVALLNEVCKIHFNSDDPIFL
jgi:hypothetical protein